jgi:hypothetical protein
VESTWVHSALRPPVGLLCQPRVIMMMMKLVEWWLAGETEVLGDNLHPCRFDHHKSHMPARTRTRAAATGTQRLTAWATAWPGPLLTQDNTDTLRYTFMPREDLGTHDPCFRDFELRMSLGLRGHYDLSSIRMQYSGFYCSKHEQLRDYNFIHYNCSP